MRLLNHTDDKSGARMKEIIAKYDLSNDRLFSSDEVKKIMCDIKNCSPDPKLVGLKRLFITTGLFVAIIAFSNQISSSILTKDHKLDEQQFFELKPGNVADPIISHRELAAHSSFEDWMKCEALATIPLSYVEEDDGSNKFIFVCKSEEDCKTITTLPTSAPSAAPSAEPSSVPSSIPMPTAPTQADTPAPTQADTLAPTQADTPAPTKADVDTECKNNADYRFRDEAIKSCVWIGATETRRANLCDSRREVRENCPMVCGLCCKDDPDFLGIQYPTGMKGCDFLSNGVYLALNYCPFEEIKTYCPVTCQNCRAYISMAPSTDGTQRPTTTDRRNGVDDDE